MDEANYLASAVHGTTKESFLENQTLMRAFVRSIEVIGEAVKYIPMSCGHSFHKSSGGRL